MKNANLRDDEGYTIVVDDTPRSFRDVRQIAIESAQFLAARHRGSKVEVLDHASGQRFGVSATGAGQTIGQSD